MAFKLLVCDDDDGIREVIKSTLKKKGFEVLEAKNGKEAVELCSKHSFDCILMDIEMPVMDGIEATKRILEINPAAVVIGITGHCNKAKDLQLAQAKEVLPKPFSTKELLLIIEKHTKNEKYFAEVQVPKNLDFAKILDDALVGCYIFDEDWKIVYVNDIVSAFTGYSKDELVGMNVFNLLYEEDIQKAKEAMNRSSLGKNVFYEVRYRTKEAKIRWAWGFNKLIELYGRRYFLGYWIDVTRQKRLEEKLRENEEFFKNLIEDSIAAVYIATESRFLYVNRATEEITGYKREELLSLHPIQDLVHPEDRAMVGRRLKERIAGLRMPEIYSFRILTKSGRVKWVTARNSKIIYQGQPAVCATVIDSTDVYELAEKLKARQDYLKLLNRIMRHDVANALTPIVFALEEFQENDVAKMALSKAEYIANLIKILRELESGIEDLKPVRLDELARKIAESFGVSFEGEKVVVMANESISIIAQNLVENAVKYGGREVKVEVQKVEKWGILRVSDRGKGIPEELKERIFDPGFSTGGGTGMGLFIVKTLTEFLGGKVKVYDNVPSGAVFEVTLPLA